MTWKFPKKEMVFPWEKMKFLREKMDFPRGKTMDFARKQMDFPPNKLWQFLTTLAISHKFDKFWKLWQILTTLTIFDNFHNSDNFDYLRDLKLLRHWLQLWKLRTWIHDNLCSWQSRMKLDRILNSFNFLVAGLKACALMSVYLMPFLIDSLLVTLVWNSAYQVTLCCRVYTVEYRAKIKWIIFHIASNAKASLTTY